MTGGRQIRGTLPDADVTVLRGLTGVRSAELRGDAISLNCADSDLAVRDLLAAYPTIRDLEITGAGLEVAFLQLTADTTNGGSQ